MSFKFTKQDEFQKLHPNITSYMNTFVENRIKALEKLKQGIYEENFSIIRDYCHNHIGVAGSYKCYKLEEIVSYIQEHARQGEIEPIVEVLPILEAYLIDLKEHI